MKTVLITGGSRGIGSEIVRLFSKNGYNVAFTYKNSYEEAKAIADEVGALAIYADNASESDIKNAVKKTREAFGKINILVNNAGVSSFSLFSDITLDEWRRMFSINVDGAFLYTREVLSDMIYAHSGRIINISSVWGIDGASCEVHYSASKSALIGLTKALAKELGPSGITVNCVAPGVIDTEMNKHLSDEDMKALIDETPLMRTGTARDVAEAVFFLSGEGASFITGNVLNVSGGFSI